MGKVLDTNPAPAEPGAAEPVGENPADTSGDGPGVRVYLTGAEHATLTAYADAVTLPVGALLRRQALTAVHATARGGVTPGQLVAGAAAALARDFPLTFGDRHEGRARRVAESVIRWLLARCAVLPLPAPGGTACGPKGAAPVWPVALPSRNTADRPDAADTVPVMVTVQKGRVHLMCGPHGVEFAAADAAAVAAAITAAAGVAGGR